MDEIDDAHAKAVCGVAEPNLGLSVPLKTDEELNHGGHRNAFEAFASIKTFATVTAPSLLLRPTAKLPYVGERLERASAHWRPASETAAQRSRNVVPTNIARARASTSPDDQRRPILLETVVSNESAAHETPSIGHDSGVAAYSTPLPSAHPEDDAFTHSEKHREAVGDSALVPIVTRHAPVLRDDRPVSHVHYNNPAEVTPLARSLWLPRDPLKPVDLGDTIDYNGRVLVSSEGGDGIIGSFEAFHCLEDDMETDDDEEAEAERADVVEQGNGVASSAAPGSPALSRKTSRAPSHISFENYGLTLKGNERIRVAADVAAKAIVEGGAGGGELVPVASSTAGEVVAGSDQGSFISGMRRRRSTQTSLGVPQSPVLRRSPHDPRPSPPAIPDFSREPEADPNLLSPRSAHGEDSAPTTSYPFPAPVPGSPSSPTSTSPTRSPKPRRLTISSLSPPGSRIGIGSPPIGSPGSVSATGGGSLSNRRRSTRSHRSNSLAPSIQHSITLSRIDEPTTTTTGDDGDDRVEVISQQAALRAELLHEEIESHRRHVKQEQVRSEQESKDRHGKSGFLARLLVRTEQAEEADDT